MEQEIVEKVLASYRAEALKFGNEYKIAIFGYPNKLFSIKDIIKEIEENPASELAKIFIESRWEYLKFKGLV
jgi:hypothetical protein